MTQGLEIVIVLISGIGGASLMSLFLRLINDYVIFGLINGLVGMIGWSIFLKSTFKPEQVNKNVFFPVILIAHLVFALGVTCIYFTLWYLSSYWS